MNFFAVEHPADILLDCTSGAVYAWQLGDEEICSKCIVSEKFSYRLQLRHSKAK
ncbi:hypothetical protein [Campylobacter concisus]|uniref:hypothetical protein n=1 Tax=Campylobacter concisus TaxID=199 RepID=UPI00165FCB4F|nr:hypothetical protein [Campylobacter concisus]